MTTLKEIIQNYKRVLTVARKPGIDEFKNSAKICGLGIALIGVIGFALFLLFKLLVV